MKYSVIIIKTLLANNKIDVNKCDKYGVNAFWIATFFGHVDVSVLYYKTYVDYETSFINQDRQRVLQSEWF